MKLRDTTTPDPGLRTVFVAAEDTRHSVWAQFTQAGRQFLQRHRRDTGVVLHDPHVHDG